MKLEKEVAREIWKMAAGCLLCALAVLGGFFVFGKLDYRVVLGALVGWALAVGNFLFLSLGVTQALETGEEASAKIKMRISYIGRTVLMIAVLAASLVVEQVHWVPVFCAVFYPRVVITVSRFLHLARVRRRYLAGVEEDGAEIRETGPSKEETADAFETLMDGLFRAPVPGEEKKEK